MKKIKSVFILIFLLFLVGCNMNNDNKKIKVVSTIFPGYDFTRAIVLDNSEVEIKMLLSPGMEAHSYEPSPGDIIDIKESDLFIYVGGESDSWINKILDSLDTKKTKVIKMIDYVDLKEEELSPSMEKDKENKDDVEYDEHVWTSPINAIKIVKAIGDELINIDAINKVQYENNMNEYINKLNELDSKFRNVVSNSKRKEIIFGDRFPLIYFAKEYNLSYDAAFPGCSMETEASAKTIASLIDKVKKDNIKVVFTIELSNQKIAKTIASESNTKILVFNTLHNVTKEDFNSSKTYVDIMNQNVELLKEALN